MYADSGHARLMGFLFACLTRAAVCIWPMRVVWCSHCSDANRCACAPDLSGDGCNRPRVTASPYVIHVRLDPPADRRAVRVRSRLLRRRV